MKKAALLMAMFIMATGNYAFSMMHDVDEDAAPPATNEVNDHNEVVPQPVSPEDQDKVDMDHESSDTDKVNDDTEAAPQPVTPDDQEDAALPMNGADDDTEAAPQPVTPDDQDVEDTEDMDQSEETSKPWWR